MNIDPTSFLEAAACVPAAFLVSWLARTAIRLVTRRAVRLAQQRPGMWRVRLPRVSEQDSDFETRRRQRADASARMLGHIVTLLIFVIAGFVLLHQVGVDPVYAISSAGFVGLAIALSGQEIIRNLLAGTMSLLEDRYAVGDEVTFTIGGNEVRGLVDVVGAASVRVRTNEGATWHAGHAAIESVTNHSQLASTAEVVVPTVRWNEVEDHAEKRLTAASNDIGLTGVVFLPGLVAAPHPSGVTTVTVTSNRPLTDDQLDDVQQRLAQPSGR